MISFAKRWLKGFPQWEGEDKATLILGTLALIALIAGYFGLIITDLAKLGWKWCEPTTVASFIILALVLFGKGMAKACDG